MQALFRRRALLACLAGVPALAPWCRAAHAQAAGAWPTRGVRVVVPAGPGSSLDLIARGLAAGLATRWGQAVVVDNKPGAGGLLGMDVAAKASDRHTLALGFNGPVAFAPFLYRKMPYDPARDLLPVVQTSSQPNVLAVNADKVPAKTVAEFVAWGKAQGSKLNYASLGNGSSAHLTMELLLAEAGLQATHVPFNGSPPAAMALAQGEVDAAFMVAPALLPHVRNHKVRLLATSSSQRPQSLQDVPSLASAGYPRVESLAWNGLFAPAGTAPATLQTINAGVNALLQDAAVRQLLDSQGLIAVGGTAADFRRTIDADIQRWGPLITRLGIQLD
jgi:tripartite-type tricarboxylate transporter receptor subunit TctC